MHSPTSTQDFGNAETPHQAPRPFDLGHLIPRLASRWYWILLGLAAGIAFGILSAKRAVPEYQTTSTLVVRDWNVTALGQLDPSEIDLRGKQAMQTVRAGVINYDVFYQVASDPVVRNLKPIFLSQKASWKDTVLSSAAPITSQEDAPPAPEFALMLKAWTNATIRPQTRFIDVTVSHTNPEVAKVVANRIIHHYVAIREKSKESGAKNTLAFLIGESERVQRELQASESLLESYKPVIIAEQQLNQSEDQIEQLSIRYLEKHPKMKDAVARASQHSEHLIEQLMDAASNPNDLDTWKDIEVSRETLLEPATFKNIRQHMVTRKSSLDNKINSQSKLHQRLLDRIESKEVTAEQGDAEVIPHEAARLPRRPFAPEKKDIIVKASTMGLGMGLLIAFAFQFFDNKVRHVKDVEKYFGLTTLSVIPRYPDEKTINKSIKDNADDIPDSVRDFGKPLLLTNWTDDAVYGEAFRVLRASVSLLGDNTKKKFTIVTSATPSEGKTSVSTNLAIAYANQGTKTLLIDFDLRKPAMHKLFSVKRLDQKGLVDLLSNRANLDECIKTYKDIPNLDVVFTGTKAPSPGELIEPGRIKALFDTFANDYDQIIIDSAPLLAVPDTRVLAPLADYILLVVRSQSTPIGPITAAIDLLSRAHRKPNGVILNDFVASGIGSYKYSYNYGYAYGSYSDSGDDD